ncbi:MAG: group II intron reverse transcriptase/maturase, partial [Acidobacteria bacterium]|nr:group II intron reverse transcriptase/maturase [Acidobacteriota bacterium]
MERVLEKENLRRALRQVRRNRGAPGMDGMTVEGLVAHLKENWPAIRSSLVEGTYKPQPVRRVEIPKAGGGTRDLGVPVVLDRFVEQALMQVLQGEWDPTFLEWSYGFCPGRSAHQAVAQAQTYIREGYAWVTDLDLEKFFDWVNHDVLLNRVRDRRVVRLIYRFLKAGVFTLEGVVEPTVEGTPQGSPLSPLLANLLLDDLDKELEKRGH